MIFWWVVIFFLIVGVLIGGIVYVFGVFGVFKRFVYIVCILIEGMILESCKMFEMIEEIGKFELVKGVIVFINLFGGSIIGGEVLYGVLCGFVEKKLFVSEMCIIGMFVGYMIVLFFDYIVVWYNMIIGLIGVLF